MASQTVAVLGAAGFIGSKLVTYLGSNPEVRLVPFTRTDLDLSDRKAIAAMLAAQKPDWVINCVAFLNADRCEKEPQSSYDINFKAAAGLAETMAEYGKAKLIHFSSDFVFDGRSGGYDEKAVPLPISYYGLHKYMADEAITASGIPAYILRIASVIGAGEGKRDLVKALLGRVADGASRLSVIKEYEISTSTPKFMAWVIEKLLAAPPAPGVYNTVADGITSWYDVARTAFSQLGVDTPFDVIPADAFPMPAKRPPKSWLKTEKLKSAIGPLPSWESAIRDQVEDNRECYLAALKKDRAA
jgi:dTDP-4-dehydrorhamnose reductase